VALIDGQPYNFECEFSEELDDYPGEYDSGLRPPPFPGDLRLAVLNRIRDRAQRQPPPDARAAIPELRLDRNRSFAGRVPSHVARWRFIS
jgi:hypothetical protein